MKPEALEKLGLTVRQVSGGLEADLDLVTLPLLNPISRKFISKVTFTIVEDRLFITAPRELAGGPPVSITGVTRQAELEQQLNHQFNEHIFHLQRRSSELQALGLNARVDPDNLTLLAEVKSDDYVFLLAADKRGNFSLAKATRDGKPLRLSGNESFELSEFRDPNALVGYLTAMMAERSKIQNIPVLTPVEAAPEPQKPAETQITFGELASKFGAAAMLPPKSPVEILVELRVNGNAYRFAAARVAGKTFRGLLAGSSGKVWAERFEIDKFNTVLALVAQVLRVPIDQVKIASK
jgi:hypothetical protein